MSLLTSLISYYKLDGNSNDAVGSNNGSDTAITYSAGNGKIVQGAGFNGTTSKIALTTAITMPTNLTISAWIKPSAISGYQDIFVDSNAGATVDWGLTVTPTGHLQFAWDSSGSDYRIYSSDNVVIDTNWHFVTVTQVGTGAPIMYVDGSLVPSSLGGNGGAATKPTAQGSAFGQHGLDGVNFYGGAIDEVGIWSRALTSGEITSLWNGGAGLAYPLVTNQGNMFLFF